MLVLAPGRRDVGVPALRHPAARELDGALVERRLQLEEQDRLLDVQDLGHEPSTVAGMEPWIDWVRRLQAVSETGLAYATDHHDVKRYEEVARLAAEVAGQGSGLDTHGAGHPTPKVDVRGALVRDGKVLLVREVVDGGWTLPGGWADIGEPPSASVEREFREEAGIPVRAVKLIAVHDRDRHNFPPHEHHIFKLFFLCRGDRRAARRARPRGRRRRLVRPRRPPAALDRAHDPRPGRARARSRGAARPAHGLRLAHRQRQPGDRHAAVEAGELRRSGGPARPRRRCWARCRAATRPSGRDTAACRRAPGSSGTRAGPRCAGRAGVTGLRNSSTTPSRCVATTTALRSFAAAITLPSRSSAMPSTPSSAGCCTNTLLRHSVFERERGVAADRAAHAGRGGRARRARSRRARCRR